MWTLWQGCRKYRPLHAKAQGLVHKPQNNLSAHRESVTVRILLQQLHSCGGKKTWENLQSLTETYSLAYIDLYPISWGTNINNRCNHPGKEKQFRKARGRWKNARVKSLLWERERDWLKAHKQQLTCKHVYSNKDANKPSILRASLDTILTQTQFPALLEITYNETLRRQV